MILSAYQFWLFFSKKKAIHDDKVISLSLSIEILGILENRINCFWLLATVIRVKNFFRT